LYAAGTTARTSPYKDKTAVKGLAYIAAAERMDLDMRRDG